MEHSLSILMYDLVNPHWSRRTEAILNNATPSSPSWRRLLEKVNFLFWLKLRLGMMHTRAKLSSVQVPTNSCLKRWNRWTLNRVDFNHSQLTAFLLPCAIIHLLFKLTCNNSSQLFEQFELSTFVDLVLGWPKILIECFLRVNRDWSSWRLTQILEICPRISY